MSMYVTRCPVGCAALLETTSLLLPEGALRRCAHCGQLISAVDEARYHETMKTFNAPDFNQPSSGEMGRRWSVAQRRLRTARGLMQSATAARWLDIGCSRGQFVAFAARAGFAAEGVEPAPDIAAAARAEGLKVHTGFLEDQRFADASFDAASLFEVVEHLRDPLPLLAEIKRILKPGGVLLISTGNTASWTVAAMGARWDYFHIEKDGGHISFFNPASIRELASASGYRVACIETARVKFHEKHETSRITYSAGKGVAELLNWPARLCGRGHDMLAFLQRE